MKLNYLFIVALFGLFIVACGDDDPPEETCDTVDMRYTSDIASILNGSCAVSGCHVDGSVTFSMDDYTDALAAVQFNRIVGAINHETGFLPMPYPVGSAKLDQCDIDKVTAWITNGAPE